MFLFKDTLMRILREKSPAPSGNQTHKLSFVRRALYRCATTSALIKELLTFVKMVDHRLHVHQQHPCSRFRSCGAFRSAATRSRSTTSPWPRPRRSRSRSRTWDSPESRSGRSTETRTDDCRRRRWKTTSLDVFRRRLKTTFAFRNRPDSETGLLLKWRQKF